MSITHTRTKIVCTIGPSCASSDVILKMVTAGMDVARLNFSHGTYADHRRLIKNIRAVEKKTGEPIALLQDLQGPKIRVGFLPKEGVVLTRGNAVIFATGRKQYEGGIIPIDYPDLHRFVKKGQTILLADGTMEVNVSRVSGRTIHTTVTVPGTLSSHKGINLPGAALKISALSGKDKADAEFGVRAGVDMIALSFVQDAGDIHDLRRHIMAIEKKIKIKKGSGPIRIIAKIERPGAVKKIKEIFEAADGIMVARGDLGLEIPAEEVPIIQKQLIERALECAKPVIVATQMLDSMQERPRPTRAEVSDVANAVIDHTDAVMLSNETAVGKYPVETVATMNRIIKQAEASVYDGVAFRAPDRKLHTIDDVVSGLSRLLAEEVKARLILSPSWSGEVARLVSRYRPELPIVVATQSARVRHQLNLSWGVTPFIVPPYKTIEELVKKSMVYLKKYKMVRRGDRIIVVAGEPLGASGHVNMLEVRIVE